MHRKRQKWWRPDVNPRTTGDLLQKMKERNKCCKVHERRNVVENTNRDQSSLVFSSRREFVYVGV